MLSSDEKLNLKKHIESEIEKTKKKISNLEESAIPISPSNAIGRLSRMEAINELEVKKAAIVKSKTHLSGLVRSLDLMDRTDYGECQECGEVINLKRLMSVPYSVVCMDCFRDNS